MLHPDILSRIYCFTTRPTDAALLRLNRETYQLVHQLLYRHIILFKQDIRPLFTTHEQPHPRLVCEHRDRVLRQTQTLTIPLHTARQCGSRTRTPLRPLLPALHTLRLELDPRSPLGWSFCRVDDGRGFPYYPVTCPCPLLRRLRPKRLIIANVASLHSLTSLVGNRDILSTVDEVTIIVDRRFFRPEAHRPGAAPILGLGANVKKVVIRWEYTGHKMEMGRPQRPKRGCRTCLPDAQWDKEVRWSKGDGLERSAEVWTFTRIKNEEDAAGEDRTINALADDEWKMQESQRRDADVPAWRFAQAAGAPWYGLYGFAGGQQTM